MIFVIASGILLLGLVLLAKFIWFFNPPKEYGVFWVEPSRYIRRFTPIGHACGGKHGSYISTYEAYDRSRLSKYGEFYSSASEAGKALQQYLKGASKVVENSSRFNEQGKVIGQRIVTFYPRKEGDEEVAIFWTDKGSLYLIEADSLKIALEFEQSRIE